METPKKVGIAPGEHVYNVLNVRHKGCWPVVRVNLPKS